MRAFVSVVAGTVAIVFGGSLVLFALPPLFVQHPRVHGASYWLAVAGGVFTPWTGRLAGGGLAMILAGVALSLHTAFPSGRDMAMSRAGRIFLFFCLVFVGASALLGLLVGITFCTIGLD